MITLKQILYFAPAAFILLSCGNKQLPVEKETNLIEITNQQFTTDGMQLGKIEPKTFENTVKCSGTIVPMPNGMAKLNAPIEGLIKSIHCQNGEFVKKNQLLVEVSGNEIIDLQKDFAEAAAIYKRLKNDYERIKLLYNEKVTPEKEFINTESEFKTSGARYNSLKLKVEAIGFSVSKIENGEFYSSYILKSPIDGYISGIKAHLGGYVDRQFTLLEITNPEMFHVQLSVFSSDIKKVKKGQTVLFRSLNSEDSYTAIISSIGVSLDAESKSIDCYASITDKKNIYPVAHEFVDSEIITGSETVSALPSEAVIKTETGNAILVLEKQENNTYLFNKLDVTIGRQYKGFIEILGKKTDGLVAVKGTYNISI